MAGARNMEVNCGREKLPCPGGMGTLSSEREKGERERVVEKCGIGFTQENLSDHRLKNQGN